MSSSVSIKFQGSQLKMNTGVQSGGHAITGISLANPAVVSISGSIPAGVPVVISGIVGMTEVNGRTFITQNPGAGTVELADTDSTGYGAYVSGGVLDEQTLANVCEVKNINVQGGSTDQLDATTICSTAKEFVAGLSDTGTIQLDLNFAPNTNAQTMLRTAQLAGDDVTIQIVLPSNRGTLTMFGTVQQSSFQGGVGAMWTGSVTLKLSGQMYVS